jgi:drug/metabolite transporter (DMT)-like permease
MLPKTKGYIALFVTSIVWGTTWIVSKIGVEAMPALQLVYMRQAIGGFLFLFYFKAIKKLPWPNKQQFKWLFGTSIIMFVMANGLSTWAVKFIPAGLGALIGALYPLCVVIIEKIVYNNQKLSALTIIGLLMGIAGIALLFMDKSFASAGKYFYSGIALSVVAMLSWSVGTIIVAKNKIELNAYYSLGWQMVISSVLIATVTELTLPTVSFSAIPTRAWLAILYLITMGSLLAFVAFIYSMKTLPAAVASLYAYINPIVAFICGAIFINEHISANILTGAAITLAGVFLVNYSIKKLSKGG